VVLAGVLAFSAPLSAQEKPSTDWPVFRGNSAQTGVAGSTLPEALAVRWSFKADAGVQGAPVILGQTVFVAALDGKLYALDLADGAKKWVYHADAFKATPAVNKGAVYIGDMRGVFHGVDAATGKKRFTVTTDGQIVSPANFAQGKILFGSDDHHLYCVTNEGRVIWMYETNEKIQSAPAVAGNRVLVAGCDQTLHVVDLATGHKVAAMPLGGHVAASVAVRGDHAYVGNMANQFLAVDWKKGAVLWEFEAKRGSQAFFASAAVTDELVVTGSRDKLVRALQRQTGKEVWAFATKGKVDSAPAVVDKRVIVGSVDGHLYVLDLASGAKLARFDLGSPITNAPAIGGQCVVVATFAGDVVCLGTKK
jgi:outer membrane protein assembly factor BamB